MFATALQYHQAGHLQQAEQIYHQVLQVDPNHLDALHLLGLLAHQVGKHDWAAHYIGQALHLRPNFAEAHNSMGIALRGQGKLEAAAASFRQAVQLRPDYFDARSNLGNILREQGKLDEALVHLHEALRLRPNHPGAHNNLAASLRDQGKLDEAVAHLNEALRLQPDYAEAHNNLGIALASQGRRDQGMACLREALRLQPNYPEALNNLGIAYWEQGDLAEATAHVQQALRLRPGYAEAYNSLGNILVDEGRLDEALAHYQEALRLQPEHPGAHKNQGLVWLRLGNWEQGWPAYEWRWWCEGNALPPFPQPLWDGSSLEGRTILLWAEQGRGDSLHFIRYAPLVKRRGGTVLVACPGDMARILGSCPGIDQLVPEGCALPPFDVHAPLLNLPGIFHTTPATAPAEVPYLFADAGLVEHWRRELSPARGFKIGIAWQGNPRYKGDHWRSIPLPHFGRLAQLDGVQLFSLQKGPGTEQLAAAAGRFPITDLGSRLDEAAGPFMDTAAVLKNLDLVITSDTAVGHLAGALAVPVWVALAFMPDWRWLLGRDDSPWYPTMRLFRQTQRGNWDEVFDRIARALGERLQTRPRHRPITVEIAPGELIDKITILEIKSQRVRDADQRANVRAELAALVAARDRALEPSEELAGLTADLRAVNEALWQIEDDIRLCERAGDFGPRFVELARSVYRHNDRRAALKRRLNEWLGSRFREEKVYTAYP